jgi:ATP-dependent DNA helicase RecQ
LSELEWIDWTLVRERVLVRDNHRCVECGTSCRDADADVHHLLPRSAGGKDEPSNLVTLCDGCHAAHHPKLAGRLARRVLERWAVWLAMWLDRQGAISEASRNFGPVLRLFGLERFRDGQLPVVEAVLSGQSVLVVSPTGFGKSLCFQLPAVLRQGVSVVVSPLKALMGEQVSALLRFKIPSTFINSDLDGHEKQLRYSLLANKSFKLLYMAPERFFVQNKSELQVLRSIRPAFLVIDEAHCIDQWGRDFRPEYARLREVREALGSPPVLAFTATAGVEMQQRVLASLGVNDARVFVRDVDRPNISLVRWKASTAERSRIIAQLCKLLLPYRGKVMIFVPTRKIGERLQTYLRDQKLDTPFYHSQLASAWDREQLVKRFVGESQPSVDRVICTSAFGMGLDVSDVRMVIHWQHPSSVEDYLQEFGRAGRDGRSSVAVLLHTPRTSQSGSDDIGLLHFMAEKTVESARVDIRSEALAHKIHQIEVIARLVEHDACFRRALVDYFAASKIAPRRSMSTRLLEWVFADRGTVRKKAACCDACCRRAIGRRGQLAFVESTLISSSS